MSVSYEERVANRDARIVAENKENQRKAAAKRQEELGYDSNFMSLLSGIESAYSILTTDIPKKAQECIDNIDIVWSEKDRRVDENDLNLDYSSFGVPKPYSYSEIRDK